MLTLLLMIIKSCTGGGFHVCSLSSVARGSCLLRFWLFWEVFSAWLSFWRRHRSLIPKYSLIHSFTSIPPSLPHIFKVGFPECLDTSGLWGFVEVKSSLSFYFEHLVSRFVYRADPNACSLEDKKYNRDSSRSPPFFHLMEAVRPCDIIKAKFVAFPWWWHETKDVIPEIYRHMVGIVQLPRWSIQCLTYSKNLTNAHWNTKLFVK